MNRKTEKIFIGNRNGMKHKNSCHRDHWTHNKRLMHMCIKIYIYKCVYSFDLFCIKHFTIVNYDSTVIIWANLKSVRL